MLWFGSEAALTAGEFSDLSEVKKKQKTTPALKK